MQLMRQMGRLRAVREMRLPWAFTLLLSCFAISTTIAQSLEDPTVLRVGYASILLLAILVLARFLRDGLVFPPEIGLYWAFAGWSLLTGHMVAVDLGAFNQIAQRVLYVGVVLTLVASYCASRRTAAPSFAVFIILALLLVAYGFASGDFELASEVREEGTRVSGVRATSLTSNANSLGMISARALAGIALFWGLSRSRIARITLLSLVIPLLAGITFSASRKSFLIVFVFLAAWLWYCYRRLLLRNLRVFLGVVLIGVLAYGFAHYALAGTMLGYRLGLAASSESQDNSTSSRLYFYTEGARILATHPITGVGLGQFKSYSELSNYAHSEYVEVLTNTGPVGAALYFSMYIICWLRLRSVYGRSADPHVRYMAGVCLASMVCYAVVGLALVQHASFTTMTLMAGIMGFAYGAEQQAQPARVDMRGAVRRPPALAPHPRPGLARLRP